MAKGIMVSFGPSPFGNGKVEFAAITTGMAEDIVAVVVELFATITTVWTAVAVVRLPETAGPGPSVIACKAEELGELDDCEGIGTDGDEEKVEENAEFEEKEEAVTEVEEEGEEDTEFEEKEEKVAEVEEEGETEDELGLVGLEEGEDGERTEVGSDRELTVGSIDPMGVLAGDAANEVTVDAMPFVDITMG